MQSKVYQLVVLEGPPHLAAETEPLHAPDPADGEEGGRVAVLRRCLAFPPGQNWSRSQPSHVFGSAAFGSSGLLNPDLLRAPPGWSLTVQACQDLRPQSSHPERGERKDVPCSMQEREAMPICFPCPLATTPFQLSELIPAGGIFSFLLSNPLGIKLE